MDKQAKVEPVRPRLASARPADDNMLTWLPAWRLREMVGAGEVSPVEVTDHFLQRIEELDPLYHAFRMVDADGARGAALKAERAVLAGEPLGPLHGIPIAIKEHIAVKGMTWWDSWSAEFSTAPRDSMEAERLKAAGAIIVGTTVAGLTFREFGDSDRQPNNPWDRSRVCGDSSSGGACAQAAAMVPISLIADGLGSTRLPAAYCGLAGLNPTRGRIPTVNWAEINSKLLSNNGPLTRDLRDTGIMMSVLSGPDGRDMACRPDQPPDYLAQFGGGIDGMKLVWTDDFGYAADYAGADAPKIISAVRKAASALTGAGAVIGEMSERISDLGWAAIKVLYADRTVAVRTEPPAEDIVRIREIRRNIWESLNRTLADAEFILSPTTQYIAHTRQQWAQSNASPDHMNSYTAHTAVANLLGWPAISIPAGLVDGMPVGLQILGKPDSEPRMLALAQSFLSL